MQCLRDMKIAVPTENFKEVWTDHFGDAPYYLIFSFEPPCLKFEGVVKNTSGSDKGKHEEGHGDPKKFKRVMEILKGVDVFAAYSVGPNVIRLKKTDKKLIIIRKRAIKDFLEEIPKKLGYEIHEFEGEIFYEILEMGGKKFEHAGFRDEKGAFPKTLFSYVSPQNPKIPARVVLVIAKSI